MRCFQLLRFGCFIPLSDLILGGGWIVSKGMEWIRCVECSTPYPKPALTKELVCYHCEPPYKKGD